MQNRDIISNEEAILKISNQMDIEEKKSLGTYIIDNSKDLKHIQNEVENLISKFLN